MNNINKIFCFGDSITGHCVTGNDHYNGLKFYPYLLGEYFDCEIENYGVSVNSNEKISIDVLNAISTKNYTNSLFVIGWSSAIRRLVYMEDRKSMENINDATETRPWYKSSVMDVFATLNSMLTVQKVLTDRNIPFVNFFGWKSDFIFNDDKLKWIGKGYTGNENKNIDLWAYKSNMWSVSEPLENTEVKSHGFDFINLMCNELKIKNFIKKEFYDYLLEKGTVDGKFLKFKDAKIPSLNKEILVISENDLHPNELGHKLWTEEVLIPHIKGYINE
jgi:hypothetical protein